MSTTLTRALSGVGYILLLVTATLYSSYSFLLLFGLLLILSVVQFCKLIHLKPLFPVVLAFFSYLLFNLNNTVKTNEILLLIATLLVSFRSILFLFEKNKKPLDITSKYVFLVGYLVLPIIIFTKIPFIANHYFPKVIISFLCIIWTNDTFAYLVGRSFGKTKLFERVSPKKTIEGFIGGGIFAIIIGVLVAKFYLNEPIIQWTIIAVLIVIFGTLGDLIESKFKRNAGVKDSGNVMPGHGGFLDRLDSIIFASPFIYLFYQILYYVS